MAGQNETRLLTGGLGRKWLERYVDIRVTGLNPQINARCTPSSVRLELAGAWHEQHKSTGFSSGVCQIKLDKYRATAAAIG